MFYVQLNATQSEGRWSDGRSCCGINLRPPMIKGGVADSDKTVERGWKSYHRPTAKEIASPLQPPDGLILEIGPRLEVPSVNFLAIQTHLSHRFLPCHEFPRPTPIQLDS